MFKFWVPEQTRCHWELPAGVRGSGTPQPLELRAPRISLLPSPLRAAMTCSERRTALPAEATANCQGNSRRRPRRLRSKEAALWALWTHTMTMPTSRCNTATAARCSMSSAPRGRETQSICASDTWRHCSYCSSSRTRTSYSGHRLASCRWDNILISSVVHKYS